MHRQAHLKPVLLCSFCIMSNLEVARQSQCQLSFLGNSLKIFINLQISLIIDRTMSGARDCFFKLYRSVLLCFNLLANQSRAAKPFLCLIFFLFKKKKVVCAVHARKRKTPCRKTKDLNVAAIIRLNPLETKPQLWSRNINVVCYGFIHGGAEGVSLKFIARAGEAVTAELT